MPPQTTHNWFSSVGTFHYGPGIRAVLLVDQDIVDYYRALMPKWLPTNPQMYDAHVSVIRTDIPPKMWNWDKYENEKIVFEYCNEVQNDETYYWLDVRCERLMAIRVELGMDPLPWWRNGFHLTIGNVKEL